MNCLVSPTYQPSTYSDPCTAYNAWGKGYCYPHIEQDFLFNNQNIDITHGTRYNYNNAEIANTIMENAILDYLKVGSIGDFVNPDTPGTIEIMQACQNLPLACDKILNQICINCTQSDVAKGPTGLITMCGCYASVGSTGMAIDGPCSATCDNSYAIQNQIDTTTGLPVGCNRTICVIDEAAIAVATATDQNVTVNVNQICNGCEFGGCVCIFDLPTSANSFSNKVNLSGDCSNSLCYRNGIKVDCPPELVSTTNSIFNVLVVVIFFFMLMTFVFILSYVFK